MERIHNMSIDELREAVIELTTAHNQSSFSLDRVAPYVKLLIVGAFVIGGWVSTLEFRQQQSDKIHGDQSLKVHNIEIWKEKTDEKIFTVKEAVKMSESILNAVYAQDKRLQRVEDSSNFIKESLERIEKTIK